MHEETSVIIPGLDLDQKREARQCNKHFLTISTYLNRSITWLNTWKYSRTSTVSNFLLPNSPGLFSQTFYLPLWNALVKKAERFPFSWHLNPCYIWAGFIVLLSYISILRGCYSRFSSAKWEKKKLQMWGKHWWPSLLWGEVFNLATGQWGTWRTWWELEMVWPCSCPRGLSQDLHEEWSRRLMEGHIIALVAVGHCWDVCCLERFKSNLIYTQKCSVTQAAVFISQVKWRKKKSATRVDKSLSSKLKNNFLLDL